MSQRQSLLGHVACLGTLAGLLSLNTADAAQTSAASCLQGSFLQLVERDGDRSDAYWLDLLTSMRQLALQQVVVQWSLHDQKAFFAGSTTYAPTVRPPLAIILGAAEQLGMSVVIGLIHDSAYWTAIQGEPAQVGVYLRRLGQRAFSLAQELQSQVATHRAFGGWYISQEIDDIHWRDPERRRHLFEFLSALSRRLHQLTPDRSVMLSAFANGAMDPRSFEEFWAELFASNEIDIVLFQDGIGAKKLVLPDARLYLNAVRDAARANARELRVVVELFEQVSGAPIDNAAFRAVPAPLGRIAMQLSLAAEYNDSCMGFSVPDYMSPAGGDAAARLYEEYRRTYGLHSPIEKSSRLR